MIQILVFVMAVMMMAMRMGRVSPPLNPAAVRLEKER
jgi:hypothetical protein